MKSMPHVLTLACLRASIIVLGLMPRLAMADPPWRIDSAAGLPDWVHFSATHRERYENLWNQFRAGAPGNDMALSLRTTFLAELRFQPVVIGAELVDSRMYLADDNTPVDTSLVDPIDLLQGYVGVNVQDPFVSGATGRIRAGRLTMDVGSRRLVARNRFRNTINAFTGLDLEWSGPSEDTVRLFATFPVQRRPTSRDALVDNTLELDRENTRALFWGVFLGSREWPGALRAEAYVFGLHERDSEEVQTRNRSLLTPGFRVYRKPARGRLDLEVEAMIQAGSSRASTRPDDTSDLEHLAYFAHGSLGYTFDVSWAPRLIAQYDYASGDADPGDGRNGRFDTLFGARRFELGPTGIYGALARSNINSPGLRVEVSPLRAATAIVAYRPTWLAQARDAWTTSGLRDASGSLGSFIGHQLEVRLQWKLLPGNIALDTGFAHTWLGEFATSAPNANGGGDPSYVYAQLGFEI